MSNSSDLVEISIPELCEYFVKDTQDVISILENTELWDGPEWKFGSFRKDCEKVQQLLDEKAKDFGYSNPQLKSFKRRINDELRRCYNIHNWWINKRREL